MPSSFAFRLSKHPFMQAIVEANTPFLASVKQRTTRAVAATETDERDAISDLESYVTTVLQYTAAVFGCIERMAQSRAYIEKLPPREYYEHADFPRFSWLEYHYAYYLVTMVGLSDITTLLTNAVFRLGIKARDAKFELIVKNEWVIYEDVSPALRQIKQAADKQRELRNQHVHAGENLLLDKVLGDGLFEFARGIEVMSMVLRLGGLPQWFDDDWREAIITSGLDSGSQKLSAHVDAEIDNTVTLLESLYNKLLPVLRQRLEVLEIQNAGPTPGKSQA